MADNAKQSFEQINYTFCFPILVKGTLTGLTVKVTKLILTTLIYKNSSNCNSNCTTTITITILVI